MLKPFLIVPIGGLLALLTAVGAVEPQPASDFSALTVSNIAARIRVQAEATLTLGLIAYTNAIPGTKASYAMGAIPGGEFVMGCSAAPSGEAGAILDGQIRSDLE